MQISLSKSQTEATKNMKLTEQKRLHILDAAEHLFYEQGVEHTSMDQIAVQAKVSKRTVYNHFDTKDALFHAIIARMQQHLGATQAIRFDPSQDIREQLTRIAQEEVTLLTSDNFLRIAKIAFLQLLQQPELAKTLGANKFGCMTYLETFLADAVQAGKLNINDFELASKQFVAQLKAFTFYPHLYGFDIPDRHSEAYVIEESVALFLSRYGA